jgi:two-component system osmolarity sensor histidine kinase EnvZ
MKLVPRSLLGRTVFVMVLTVILTQLATTLVFTRFYIEPLLTRSVEIRVNHIQTILTALTLLPENDRARFIRNFEDSEGARLLPRVPGKQPSGAPPDPGSRVAQMETMLRQKVSPDTRILVSDDSDTPEVWVTLNTPGGEFWYVTQRRRFDAGFPAKWGIMLGLGVVLAVIAVYFGVRRLNRPVTALTQAAHRIAAGEVPEPVPETDGPQEIRSLAIAFNSMQKALREFEANRTIMLAGVSHDLRTPLSRLRLAMEISNPPDPKTLEPMVQDLEEIDRIISQFLDFARDNPTYWLNPGNVSEVAQVAFERFHKRGYPVILELQNTPDIPINERAIERVITNLVENALRYGEPPITIRTELHPDHVRLSVLDRGPGIPPKEVARLVQPFTRMEPSRSGHPGAGLGLAIVDRVARLHHGILKLLPRQGGGLEARLELPITLQEAEVPT